jgi:YD repeat-containing protein
MKAFLIFSFLFLFAQLPVPHPANNAKPFGVIDDSYEVNSLGAYNHIIPIHVPTGINSLAPSLAIAYDSRAGLSEMGLGWSLSGLSKITRGPKNLAENGVVGAMNFSTDDALLLDGQYLTCIEGKNTKPNSAYRTENETFSIVRGLGTVNNATASAEHFVIKHTNGMTYYYGVTDDSRIQVNLDLGRTEVLEWEVNRIEDQFGNYMTFQYQQNNNRAEILSIKYTGNIKDQLAPTNEVDFTYDDAKRICNTQYIFGQKSNNESVLQSIEVKTNGRYFKYYNLKYNEDKSKLVSVVESRDETQQTALPATTITWNVPDSLTFNQQNAVPITDFEKSRILDINNDGKDEKIFIEKKNSKGIDSISFSIYSGENSGFSKLIFQKNLDAWTPNIDDLGDKIVFADLNGDGLVDIITDNLILENTTSGGKIQFSPFGSTCADCKNFLTFNGNGSDSKVLTQDLIGNGKQEIILASLNKAGAQHKVLRINKTDQLELVGTFSGNYNANSFYPATVESGGLEELVCFEPNNLTGKRVTVSNDKIVERPLLLPADFEQGLIAATGFSFKDINLDGLDDIVEMKDNTPIKVWMNDGVKFAAAPVFTDAAAGGPTFYSGNNAKLRSFLGSFSNSSNLQLLNLNAGVIDLYDIHLNAAGQIVFNKVNAPKIQLPGALVATPSTISYYDWDFNDLNGDGRPDIKLKTRSADNKLTGIQQFLAPTMFIDKIAAIQDGFENLVKIDYGNLKDSLTYSCDNKPLEKRYTYYWGNYIFVKSLSESNGLKANGLNSITYRYNSLIAENTGRGLSGFQQMEKTEGPTGNLTRSTYLHLFPYTGKIQHQQKVTREGVVYFDQTNTWGIKQYRGGIEPREKDKVASLAEVGKFSKTKISYLLVMNRSVAVKKDLDNVISSTSEINYSYNQFGQLYNTKTLLNKETLLTEGKTFYNINADISETGTYIMGMVATDTTYVTRNNTVSGKKVTSYVYDGKTGATLQKFRQQGDADYEQNMSYSYDNCGNLLTKTLFPGTVDETKEAYTYTYDGRFPKTYTNPLGFVTTYEYEPEYGNKTSETDPNGLTTKWVFDEFGNLVKIFYPARLKSLTSTNF